MLDKNGLEGEQVRHLPFTRDTQTVVIIVMGYRRLPPWAWGGSGAWMGAGRAREGEGTHGEAGERGGRS